MQPITDESQDTAAAILAQAKLLFERGQVVELRVPKGGPDGTVAGYFNNGRELAAAAARLNGRYPGIYVTLNPLRPELLERAPNRVAANVDRGTLATDGDVTARRWLPVDIDPVRPADASSTDAELALAHGLAGTVADWLTAQGWPRPIRAESGNGAHLLYRVDLPNDDGAHALLHGVLKRLHQLFSTPAVKIDTKVANASRIWKLYGTVAAKGQATPERPHREARMLETPAMSVVEPELLAAVQPVAEAPRPAPAQDRGPAPVDQHANRYAIAALEDACRLISAAVPGERNDTLNREAYGVLRLVAGGSLAHAVAWSLLENAAAQCGLDAKETRQTMLSAWEGAQADPKTAPAPREPRKAQAPHLKPGERWDPDTGEITGGHAPSGAPEKQPSAAANDNAPPVTPLNIFAEFPAPGLEAGMLPEAIEHYAQECGELIGVDASMIALPALVACAAALHDGVVIQPKRFETSWTESARLWCAVVGAPSVKKSPAIRRATRRLRRMDADMSQDNGKAMAAYNEQVEQHKEAKKEARKTGGSIPAPDRPQLKRLIVEDITVEALSEVLKDNARGVLCIQDELSGWFGSMDAYTGGKAGNKDRAAWLQAYNGGFRQVDRVMRGEVRVPNFSVSMIGGIQPDAIRRIAKDMTDDGLMQRFMIVIGRNAREDDRIELPELTGAFADVIDGLHGIQPSGTAVTLTDGAHRVREALMTYAAELADYPALPGGLRSHMGKWPGLFARLLLTYHAVAAHVAKKHPTQMQVSEATARQVDALMRRFLLPHALAYYTDILGANSELEHARWVAGHVLSKGLLQVSNRDLMQAYKQWRGMDDWRRQRVMQVLEDMGWLTAISEDGKPRRGVTQWAVNATVHELFARRASDEAERRDKIRAELSAIQKRKT